MSPVKSPEEFGDLGVGKQDKIVVEKDEAEELPPGWTKEVKLRKTGSATKVDRYYTDPVTGYIFHSLKDVQRYLKTGKLGRLATKPKIVEGEDPSELKQQMSETLRNKREDKPDMPARASKRLAGINNDAILPSQPKTRQAIRLAGINADAPSLLQSLTEPETRQATRLAGVVVDALPSPPEPKTRQATQVVEVVVDVSLPSPSPPEPKTRQATRLAGVAVDASLSPPERKTRQATQLVGVAVDASPSPPEPKTRQATRLAGVSVNASPSSPEPKTRQATQLAGVAVDASPSPPEPKTRQATRLAGVSVNASPSSPEPKTRQATRLAEVAVDASLSSPSPSPPEPKTQPKTRQATRLAGVAVNVSPSPPEPKTRHTTRLAEVAVTASLPSSSSQPEPKTRQATRLDEMAVDAALPSPSPPDTSRNRQATKQPEIKIDASVPSLPSPSPPEPKTRQATPLKRTEIGPSPPSQPEPKTRQAKRAAGIRDNASPSRPKTRRATEQAGIKINSPPPSPPDARTSRQATRTKQGRSSTPKEIDKNTEAEKITDKHNDNADMDIITPPNQESNGKQEPHIISPPVTPKEHNKQIETGPTTSQPPEAQPPPTVVPLVNIEKQESHVVNPTISNPVPQDSYNYGSDMKPDSSINFSMNDLWTDPCIEFAVKTLTGAIPFTDLNKVENFTAPAEVPLQDFWTDPCIEFAVKTLTGAIPIGEDDYLLHRPASSSNPQGLHNFSSPMNVCQTGHKNKQQDSVFTTLGNSGLQKSGKFVNGDYGQCSRSRFFQ
ncbi:putative Methyl-CpG-binding domain-containing protein [Helianthus annuus]|nr:putative Methyl-CpG-binding domain-containing protein [Helianthus annuus]KAJ0707256.1 putative Methyl-CpG-binding domain-containing protein [Helianthus annuus]